MLKILKIIGFSLITILDFITIYKNKNFIIFSSFPDFSHNCLAVFSYLVKKNYKLIWLIESKNNINYFKKYCIKNNIYYPNKIFFIKKKSVKGLIYYLISKHIFFTHGIYGNVFFPKSKIVINLWHGMPIKPIGVKDNQKIIPKCTYLCVTSHLYIDIFSESLKVKKEKILITGQPINDFLFNNKLKNLDQLGIRKKNKIFVWMPTWKKEFKNNNYEIKKLRNIQFFNKFPNIIPLIEDYETILKINDLLKFQNNYLLIKIHPLNNKIFKNIKNLSNILFLNDDFLIENNLNLYEVISYSDYLISDFSSVVIDYLLLNKPIILVKDNFSKNSLSFNKKIFDEIFIDNNKIDTVSDLFKLFIDHKNLSIIDKKIVSKYHFYNNNFTKRLLQYINL